MNEKENAQHEKCEKRIFELRMELESANQNTEEWKSILAATWAFFAAFVVIYAAHRSGIRVWFIMMLWVPAFLVTGVIVRMIVSKR